MNIKLVGALFILFLIVTTTFLAFKTSNQTNELKRFSPTQSEVYPENVFSLPPPRTVDDPVMPIGETITMPQPITDLPKNSKCFIGGCSGQVCSAQTGINTTCEWRESYACYQKATCEIQSTGQCGWTETAELRSCLINTEQG